jgi:hypothetical protein
VIAREGVKIQGVKDSWKSSRERGVVDRSEALEHILDEARQDESRT